MGVVWLVAVAVAFATAVLRRARSPSPTQLVRGLEAAQNAVADAPGLQPLICRPCSRRDR